MTDQLDDTGAVAQTLALCERAKELCAGGPFVERADALRERLDGPLRIAIAGRVKAGKSTLLNALVGERLAPTDAGECTVLVTTYSHATGYSVDAKLRDGKVRTLNFTREDGQLAIDLGVVATTAIDQIAVGWPASSLERMTLIDTPGLASVHDENSVRTRDFLENTPGRVVEADAMIYLMRHLHERDVEFLDAFMDRSTANASPVNAIAVLSRADEIGAGRIDALDSANRIATRYRGHADVRRLCSSVVCMAGLLAETGLTLREDEAASLRMLAATEPAQLERMLLSADTFCELSVSSLTVEIRRDLLDRLGLYGVRFAMAEITEGRATTAVALAKALVERSGLGDLRRLLTEHFLPRARVLQARSALAGLRLLGEDLRTVDAEAADEIQRLSEQIEASANEFAQLRTAHLVLSGVVKVDETERAEIERALLTSSLASALGVGSVDAGDRGAAQAQAGIDRWRTRGADPLAPPAMVEVCDTMTRTYERFFTAIGQSAG